MCMRELESIKVEKEEYLYFPPILDESPTFSADFLTIEESKICYAVLRKVYEELIARGATNFILIKESMLQNKECFFWFLEFFRELENILDAFPLNLDNVVLPKEEGELAFYPPMRIKKKRGKYVAEEIPIKIRVADTINKYRVYYIGNSYEVDEFRGGYPAWYSLNETTVFEKYDEKTNTRVRINFLGGEFIYFIAGASDNWQQIQDVPIEIDYVVSALLFRN